ncbi:MAG: inositol monophosphatase family protein [Candidatus Thorarchaeota archaeon]
MTVMYDMKKAVEIAKHAVLDNLESSTIRTGVENPFGDKTLLLDQTAEDNVVEYLQQSNTIYSILTEEKGLIEADKTPEYLVILDPIDGSANLERGIPLVSVGISAAPYSEYMTTDSVEISIIDSFFTNEQYIAVVGEGAKRNGKPIKPVLNRQDHRVVISYDTKKKLEGDFGRQSFQTLQSVYDMRRTGSNLLDLCWTASGALDAMIDLRNILPIIHVSGTHMVFEAGGYVLDINGNRFSQSFDMNRRMSFVAARDEKLAQKLLYEFNRN